MINAGYFRVMISHGSTGGFNCAAVDETDARPTADMSSVNAENLRVLYAGSLV